MPRVIDADALNRLAEEPVTGSDWVLTPHSGEAARLLDCSIAEVEADRPAAVIEIQKRYGGVCVLKGVGTLVAVTDGAISLCDRGNPGMASAGMGDLLAGVIGGLLAQGLSAAQAACAGVWLHASAGDLAAGEYPRGLVARDLLEPLRRLVNRSCDVDDQ
jgi:NAD(P)H-hydrate epimerase